MPAGRRPHRARGERWLCGCGQVGARVPMPAPLGDRHRADRRDATERRITELYTKAFEQLGNDKGAVRLGGLYALERLAQDNPPHRQTIVNVICAYLRMPFPPAAPASINGRGRSAAYDAAHNRWKDTVPPRALDRDELVIEFIRRGDRLSTCARWIKGAGLHAQHDPGL